MILLLSAVHLRHGRRRFSLDRLEVDSLFKFGRVFLPFAVAVSLVCGSSHRQQGELNEFFAAIDDAVVVRRCFVKCPALCQEMQPWPAIPNRLAVWQPVDAIALLIARRRITCPELSTSTNAEDRKSVV